MFVDERHCAFLASPVFPSTIRGYVPVFFTARRCDIGIATRATFFRKRPRTRTQCSSNDKKKIRNVRCFSNDRRTVSSNSDVRTNITSRRRVVSACRALASTFTYEWRSRKRRQILARARVIRRKKYDNAIKDSPKRSFAIRRDIVPAHTETNTEVFLAERDARLVISIDDKRLL